MFGRRQNLYFFDQESKTRVKRARKPVDQLPFSLPYTGVSGTLKVEAYLRQQIKISEAAGDSGVPQTPEQGTNKNDKAVDNENKTKDTCLQQEDEQPVSRTTRKGKLFTTFSDYNEPDEEEDTQRFLFEENKFAAPNLLAHLGRMLEILYETQADESRVNARGRSFDNWANLTTSNNRYLDITTSNFNLRAIGISIPFHLTEKLKWNFEQLILNTVYTKRQWQTTGYKHQATRLQSVSEELTNQVMSELHETGESKSSPGDIDDHENNGKAGHGKRDSISAAAKKSKKSTEDVKISHEQLETPPDGGKRGSISSALKKSRKSTDEQHEKTLVNIETVTDNKPDDNQSMVKKSEESHGDQLLKPNHTTSSASLKQESNTDIKNEETNIKDGELPKSVQGFRRETLKCINAMKTPRTRLEKYKYIPDKSSLGFQWRRKFDKDVNKEKEKDEKKLSDETTTEKEHVIGKENDKEYVSYHKIHKDEGQMTGHSIAFSLMSKACEENGWVHHVSPDADLERLTVIEWARARLQEAINKSSEYNLDAHGSKLVIKQYGELKTDVKESTKNWAKEGENSPISITKFVTFMPEIEDTILKQTKTKKISPVVLKEYAGDIVPKIKKGKQKIKRTSSGTAKIDLFVIVLPDDTLNLYYPSGKIAVCTARNMAGEGKYTYVYASNDETLLAYFTPTNAFCYDKHGKFFMCTPKEGSIYNKENSVIQHWTWTTTKLNPGITFELNDFLILKISTRNQMNLHFSARKETYKLNVGITQDLHCVLVNSAGEMMTTGDYLSEIAQQLTVVKTVKIPRTRREERKARAQQRKQSHQSNPEDMQEQRQEDLDKRFPERKNLALDLPADIDLYKMRRRIKDIVYDWMESYRLLAGISAPVKIPDKKRYRKPSLSAKSLPGKMPSSQVTFRRSQSPMHAVEHRAPSAPPLPRGKKVNVVPLDKLVKSVEGYLEYATESRDGGVTPVYLTEMDREKILINQKGSKPPFRCGMMSYENRISSLKDGCPVALRAELLGEKYPCCRCRKREIPFLSDLAYDKFIKDCAPHTQLLIVSIVSSRNPSVTQCTSMLEQLYYEKNRNRSFPCAQSRSDPYRIVLYNIDNVVKIQQPLLVKRHNVIPGMFLMYIGGKLLFVDHIFNGYGNARKDFLKQIAKTRKDYLQGLFLPSDFRLSPTPCRSGPRAPWGGEIGGISRSALCHTSDLDVTQSFTSPAMESRLHSATTTLSSESSVRANGTKSAASFINLGLAIDSPLYNKHFKDKSSTLLRKTAPAKTRA